MDKTQQMLALMRRLRIEMNGAVAGAMQDYGIDYKAINYGVSIPTIKDIAAEYHPNHELALHLWQQGVRELKIAAVYIDDPKSVVADQMHLWAKEFATRELMEQAVMKLFYASPAAVDVAQEWVSADGEVLRRAGAYLIGRIAGSGGASHADLEAFIDPIVCRPADTAATVYALRQIGLRDDNLKIDVKNTLPNLTTEVADELAWQLFDK